MRVAIDARLFPGGVWGGVEQFVTGLVYGLGQLGDNSEEYIIVGHWENPEWLAPYLGANQRIVSSPRPKFPASAKPLLGSRRGLVGKVFRKSRYYLRRTLGLPTAVLPPSTGFYESLGVDLVHFPIQNFSLCRVPTIFNPHDLQHLHYPQFFPPEELARREPAWPTACRIARAVATDAQWVKMDVQQRYRIAPEKIFAIPMGPPTALYGTVTEDTLTGVSRKFALPQQFAFYPAQTWQHKNHLRLIEAIALLRDHDDIVLNLVCTGKPNDFYRVVEQRVRERRLETQVHFLGFVEPIELRALYRLAHFVIHPSLFEGGGLPILEAFCEGAPVTCANTTSLPEYAGDAALYFDPTSIESIADAAKRMIADAALRASLRSLGTTRVQTFTWERTAKSYRALYRLVAGRALTADERVLLGVG